MNQKNSWLFVHYAVPQMIGMLFNSVYVIVDGVFIGHRLGTEAMAAAAVGVPMVEVLIALSLAIASGAGVLVMEQLVRGDDEKARRIFQDAVLTGILFGILFLVLGIAAIDPVADLLGATPKVHEMAVTYLSWIMHFSVFLILSYLLGGLARNDGAPVLAMASLTVGSLSNIFLDWLFMYPLNMGIGGAALATAIGPGISCALLLPHFLLRKGKLYFVPHRPDLSVIPKILRLGFPSFIMEFSIGIITYFMNHAIVDYGFGEKGLAAYLVIGYLMLMILTVFLGFSEGLQPVFSAFAGMKRMDRIRSMRRFATILYLAAGITCCLLVVLAGRAFLGLFNPEDPDLTDFAYQMSLLYFFGFPAAGCSILQISSSQAIGKTGDALVIALLRSLILPPVLLIVLPRIFGAMSMWTCHSIAEIMTAAAAYPLAGRQKLEEYEKRQPARRTSAAGAHSEEGGS